SWLTQTPYNSLRHDPHKVAHRFLLANRKCAAILPGEPKCARRSSIEIQRAPNFQIIGQSRCGKNRRQFGERHFRASSKHHTILRSRCDKSAPGYMRIIQAWNKLVVIDEKWSRLDCGVRFLLP